jgi:hypothetical protein
VARFDQVIDVSDVDRDLAFANVEKAANYYDVNLAETSGTTWAFSLNYFVMPIPAASEFRIFASSWRR